jgi:prepilin-type N-terminal cleavage/methylation domain-containing protein/prepilin-type processing-associated H-X9-DG protein
MNTTRKQNRAFTLTELIVVVALITLLSAVSLSAVAGAKAKAQRIACSSNLKQVGLAFRAWGIAHNGNTPMTLSMALGGDAEDVGMRTLSAQQKNFTTGTGSRGVSMMFLCMSNELSTPKVLFCPAEYESYYRQAATTFSGVGGGTASSVPFTNDLNVSYFIGVDAQETWPQMFLAGDHNLGGNANPPTTPFCGAPMSYSPSFAVTVGTNWVVNMGPAFMANQHNQEGNVLMADGSVEWFNRSELQTALKKTGDSVHTSPGNFATATGTIAGAGLNRIQLP